MTRWEPNARGRLEQAAMELFAERGFERVTVAEIAGRAGLTERTFFRHFTDKREVLFAGSELLRDRMVAAVGEAPADATPLDAVAAGLQVAAALIGERRELAPQRATIVAANAELRERELIKLAALAVAVAQALRGRGVAEPAASLAAEAGMAVFRVAFERWVADPAGPDLPQIIETSLAELRSVAAAG